jgi:hypothetical protein
MVGTGARRTGRAAAKGVYVASGARGAGRRVRAETGAALQPLRRAMGAGEFSKYDPKTGRLREGQRVPAGEVVGRTLERAGVGRGADYQVTQNIKNKLRTDKGVTATNVGDTEFTPAKLRNKNVGQALLQGHGGAKNMRNIGLLGNVGQVESLAKNTAIAQMKGEEQVQFVAAVEANLSISDSEKAKIIDEMYKTIEKASKGASS